MMIKLTIVIEWDESEEYFNINDYTKIIFEISQLCVIIIINSCLFYSNNYKYINNNLVKTLLTFTNKNTYNMLYG